MGGNDGRCDALPINTGFRFLVNHDLISYMIFIKLILNKGIMGV